MAALGTQRLPKWLRLPFDGLTYVSVIVPELVIALVVIPPIGFVVRKFSRRLRQMSRESQRAIGGIAEVLDESIANQRVVRVFEYQE